MERGVIEGDSDFNMRKNSTVSNIMLMEYDVNCLRIVMSNGIVSLLEVTELI